MNRRYLLNILLSLGISLLLLGLLLGGVSDSAEPALRSRLLSLLANTLPLCIGLYVLTSLSQAFFRTLRYRLILKHSSGEANMPGLGQLFIVTLSRNMFVDMLPARLGELSYIAMLNRGFKVGADACLSSLAISFVFDLIALALLLFGIMGVQLLTADFQPWLIGVFLMIIVVSAAGLFFLFPLLHWFNAKLAPFHSHRWASKFIKLTEDTAASLNQARQAGIAIQVLALSVAVRIFKYLGLYLLFLGVALSSFPELRRDIAAVLVALVSAEAGSALPVPTFMSFGTYEAGGALALTVLGAAKTASVLVMLTLHIWSQAVDYALGIAALILFIILLGRRSSIAPTAQGKKWLLPLTACLFCAGLAVFALQVRNVGKMGAFRPPKPGQPIPTAEAELAANPILTKLRGFVIWSSNRFGTHDLVMLTLPERKLTRLTSDPHTDYFPRISPDGSKVVFARSQEPWVSQRNKYPWDAWLLDLPTGKSRLLAKNANTPTWSADGKKIYFQRQANQFVEYVLATGKETVVFETGKSLPLDASLYLETPAWSEARQSLAVTMRKNGPVYTYLIGPDRTVREVNEGCELNWSPDSSFLYHVGHGEKGNVFYKINPDTLERQLWFDSPSEYSHEYFPKIANTGDLLVYGASTGGHEHDTADYEIFLWPIGSSMSNTARLSFHTGNDNWPDVFLY
ncbi:MAG: WD40-like Beta Propeller Repeat [Candidatus Electronema aureum]|uniref:WD40-like Beta Propeller Repeat n=1 Tax=Candidatus Electronema aureum TaxID=2005002 RepID=A0A521G0P8_9BACT|nr:MAG: WD40-like Beta Propeller Repeat [Candidatus Electronema aureum]